MVSRAAHSIQMGNQKWLVTVLRTLYVIKTSVTLKVRNKIKWTLNTRSQSKHSQCTGKWLQNDAVNIVSELLFACNQQPHTDA